MITASTSGTTNSASVTSTSTGDNTEAGTAVAVFVGDTATLGAESFTTGDAANYTASDWVCNDAASSTVAAGGTLAITSADAGNTIKCTVTNTIVNTQLQLEKVWSGAIAGDAITADTTGLTNNASLASTSTGDNTEAGAAVMVTVGETATLAAEVFTTGDAVNYTVSDWVCDDAANSTVVADGTLDIAAGDAGNTITCTVTNTRVNPVIDLAKSVNGPAVRLAGGKYTVEYTITATNSGDTGTYDLIDAFTPGVGITLDSATAVYMAGTEDSQTGTPGAYPNFVTDEDLANGLNESWIVTAIFSIDLAAVTVEGNDCDEGNAGGENTGFTNGVTGSDTDNDATNDKACTEFIPPGISLDKTADVSTYIAVGDLINYSYLITNLGPDILDPGVASVVDDQETVACPPEVPLAVGATVTCTATHVVIQADLDAGSLINVATAMVDDVTSNEDTLTVTVGGEPPPSAPPIAVPTLDWRGLLVMIMLMLFTGLYLRPSVLRR